MPYTYVNRATALLGATLSDSATSIAVETGKGALWTGASVASPIRSKIVEGTTVEIVDVTARSTDTLTLVRAVEDPDADTTAVGVAFTAAARITACVTAEMLEAIEAAGVPGLSPLITDQWEPVLRGIGGAWGSGSTLYGNNTLYVYAVRVSRPVTVKALGAYLTAVDASNADAVARFGIWEFNQTTRLPGALILDAGTVSVYSGSARALSVSASDTLLVPGVYCFGIALQGTANGAQIQFVSGFHHAEPLASTGTPGAPGSAPGYFCHRYVSSGAFSAGALGAGATYHTGYLIWMRHA